MEPSNITFSKSPRSGKKYRVEFSLGKKDYVLDFGQLGYEHFKDKTPLKLYSNLDHMDRTRRKSYLSRSRGIRNGSGKLTKDDPRSSNYWSIRYLW